MRSAWKSIVLIAGIVAVAGFFMPFVKVHFAAEGAKIDGGVSAYQIVTGIDDISEVLDGAKPFMATNAELREFAKTFNKDLAEYRSGMVAFYIPAVLLALVGALAGIRRRMGRIAGTFALLFGAANICVWLLFDHVRAEQKDAAVTLGIGLHVLLIAGIAGALAGLGALIAPDRGRAP